MSIFLANPWGLLALAAIPALVAIHFLQEQSRRVRASTLFLLEHARPTSEGGLRIERFQNSLPFWMQIIAACALAWLLADPRWVRAAPRQTVAVVLDSSASLHAFRQETLAALAKRLRGWEAVTARTDWHLLETGPRRPPLYAGPSLDELLAAAENRWQPLLGSHSRADALVAARALVPESAGGVILVTDRAAEVPADVAVLSVAQPTDNVGFSGGRVDIAAGRVTWRVLVTNHSDSVQTRQLTLRRAGSGGLADGGLADGGLADGEPLAAPQRIELTAGQSRTFTAEWPADAPDQIVLTLDADRFTLDDTLPLVRPIERQVRLVNRLSGSVGDLLGRMLDAAGGIEPVADSAAADLIVDRLGSEPAARAILVGEDGTQEDDASDAEPSARPLFSSAWVAAEDHPLVRELGWGGLLSGPAGDRRLSAADTPLLWKADRPLAFLRPTRLTDGRLGESLVLNWDLANSNAAQTAAMVVMMARFVEQVREQIPRGWAANFDTGQAITLPGGRTARAPESPGFFSLPMVGRSNAAQAGESPPLLVGAAQFADARQSDLRGAGPLDTLDTLRMELIVKRSVEDPWAPLWVTLAATALLVAWSWRRRS